MAGSDNLFEQARAAAQQKDFATARTLLKYLLKQEPQNINAWLLGARVVESNTDAIRCYERVLQIDPTHSYAQQKLTELRAMTPAVPAFSTPPEPNPSTNKVVPFQPIPIQAQAQPQPQPENIVPSQEEIKAKTNRQIMIALVGVFVGICCLAILGVAALPSLGLSQASSQATPTSQQLFNVLYKNAKASNTEDLDAYMDTIHPSSGAYITTRAALGLIFSQFDLSFRFYNLKVISVNGSEAKVHFSLETKKIRGPNFTNNTVTGTMILRPDNGVWKIYSQEIEDTEY